jgi:hypothetical protein
MTVAIMLVALFIIAKFAPASLKTAVGLPSTAV